MIILLFFLIIILLATIKKKIELFEEQNIFLISNDKKINDKNFKQIKKNDLVVCMNTSFHSNNKYLKKNKKILFLRANSKSYFGYKEHFSKKYSKVFFFHNDLNNIDLSENNIRLFNNFKENKEIIKFKNIINKDINYPKNKSPTTGFVTYLTLKKLYPHKKIILIGFNGPNKYYEGWSGHDYIFEQKYYLANKIKNLN